jgi:hypothetical protein
VTQVRRSARSSLRSTSAFTNTDAQEGSPDPGWAMELLTKAIIDLQAGWA